MMRCCLRNKPLSAGLLFTKISCIAQGRILFNLLRFAESVLRRKVSNPKIFLGRTSLFIRCFPCPNRYKKVAFLSPPPPDEGSVLLDLQSEILKMYSNFMGGGQRKISSIPANRFGIISPEPEKVSVSYRKENCSNLKVYPKFWPGHGTGNRFSQVFVALPIHTESNRSVIKSCSFINWSMINCYIYWQANKV